MEISRNRRIRPIDSRESDNGRNYVPSSNCFSSTFKTKNSCSISIIFESKIPKFFHRRQHVSKHGFAEKRSCTRPDGSASFNYHCECRKFFSARKKLVNHIRFARVGKVFTCPYCSRRYTTHRTLAQHIKGKHEIDYSFIYGCHVCGATFENSEELALHRKLAGHSVVKLGKPKVGPAPPKDQPLITMFFKRVSSNQSI